MYSATRGVLSLCFLLHAFASLSQTATHHVQVTSSQFTICGKTNVNDFECYLDQGANDEALVVTSAWQDMVISFNNLILRYPVAKCDCGMEAMTKDLKKTLKEDKHPEIALEINEMVISKESKAIDHVQVDSAVSITLGGVTKEVKVRQGSVVNHSESALTLSGSITLNLRDFKIDPPEKFWGMVQVKEEILVSFCIDLNVQPNQ